MKRKSLEDVHSSIDTLKKKGFFKKLLAFMGPAYLISAGYMDPGNWATDLAGGSQFGYELIWVLLMSNIMALLLQSLSVRLGIVRGLDLAQANRETYPKLVNFGLYILAEIAIIATDLAEIIGMAIGLNLLFGLPIIWGVIVTFLDTFILLFLINKGMKKIEAFILSLVSIIGIAFLIEIFFAKPDFNNILKGFIPSIPNENALYIALGIIGATVMPHNLYLHSSLVQTRKFDWSQKGIKEALRYNLIDSAIALNLAFFVNAAILILAAATFYKAGLFEIAEIQDAYKLLEPLLGSHLAPVLFAIALIAAGQSSTITGTLAGQIIMEGFINIRIQPWVRRLITRTLAIAPATFIILYYGSSYTGKLLVFSQVILSLQLGFAIIPLIHFVSDKNTMENFVIGRLTKLFAWSIAIVIIILNSLLLISELKQYIQHINNSFAIFGLFIVILSLISLLLYISIAPFITGSKTQTLKAVHKKEDINTDFLPPIYKNIVIALDFSDVDAEVLRHALALGKPNTTFLLTHIVESIPAIYHHKQSRDFESVKDEEILLRYAEKIRRLGYKVETEIGYGSPKNILPSIAKNYNADVIVLGSHGHKLIKDILFGTTINSVRHQLKIPVFVVRK